MVRVVRRKLKVPTNGATEFVHAMKTRSATKATRVEEEEAAEPLPLDKLAPEVLNIIAEALTADEDILIPRHLGSLARSCKVIKEAVKDAKDKLKVEYTAARALVVKCGWTYRVERLAEERPTDIYWDYKGLTAADAPALTNVLKSKALAKAEKFWLGNNKFGDEGAAADHDEEEALHGPRRGGVRAPGDSFPVGVRQNETAA